MKQIKNISIMTLVCLSLSLTAFAQNAKDDKKKIYKNIEVEQFTATDESKFPAEKLAKLTESVYKNFQRTNRFDSIKLNGETALTKSDEEMTSEKTDTNGIDDSEENDGDEMNLEDENTSMTTEKTETTTDSSGSTLRVSGEVVKYKKGSRAARYMIGFGAGATKIVAEVTFTDIKTGEVVLKSKVDGDVWIGLFGGDSDDAKNGVADEIMKVLKKNNLVGDKMKK